MLLTNCFIVVVDVSRSLYGLTLFTFVFATGDIAIALLNFELRWLGVFF